jgi:hypothetical protein
LKIIISGLRTGDPHKTFHMNDAHRQAKNAALPVSKLYDKAGGAATSALLAEIARPANPRSFPAGADHERSLSLRNSLKGVSAVSPS